MAQPKVVPLTREEKDLVIKHAGPHRTVHFQFDRNKRGKLVCTGASIPTTP